MGAIAATGAEGNASALSRSACRDVPGNGALLGGAVSVGGSWAVLAAVPVIAVLWAAAFVFFCVAFGFDEKTANAEAVAGADGDFDGDGDSDGADGD